MYNFYIDDAYIRNSKGDKMPTINALGGVVIHKDEENKLIDIIKSVKQKYTHENMPLKWNFKDTAIQKTYKEFGRDKEYDSILKASRDIRLDIIRKSLEIDFKIIVSCIKSYSDEKTVVCTKKQDFSQILFENLMFRIGNEANIDKSCTYQVIMDWPTDNNPSPYNRAYYYLYNTNNTLTGNKNYCGPLKNLGFYHSLFFTKCTHSPCLQFTDLIIGAFKDYLEMCLHKREKSCLGEEVIDIIRDRFRKSEKNKIVGYGIVVPSGNISFKNTIGKIFDK